MPPTEKMGSVRPVMSPRRSSVRPQGQGAVVQGSQVAGLEAHQGKGHGAQGGDHQFAGGAGGQGGAAHGVDNLRVEVVLGEMESRALAATEGQPRPHDFGDAVGGGHPDLVAGFDLPALLRVQGRGHQQGGAQAELRRGEGHAVHHRQQVAGQRRGGDQHRGLVVPHHHELLGEAQAAGGDHRGPQVFGPGLEVPAPVGQPRRQDDLQDIFTASLRKRRRGGRAAPARD